MNSASLFVHSYVPGSSHHWLQDGLSSLSTSKALLLDLRSRLIQRSLIIRILEATARLALLELNARTLTGAYAHARSPRTAADRSTCTTSRAAICVVDAATFPRKKGSAFQQIEVSGNNL